ncbi:MAG: methylmalonyl-CoA mutase family protein [Sandaracinus sp.]
MLQAWREKVEKDLGGVAFERALVTVLAGGLRIEPLYEDASALRLARSGALRLAAMCHAGQEPPSVDPGEGRWIVGSTTKQGDPTHVHEWSAEGVTHVCEGERPLAHALDVHDQGGSIPLELAVSVARALDAIRRGGEAHVAVAVGTETFVEVAKLRALRALLERASAALGARSAVRILARTSLVGFSRIEPETNALRATSSVVGAILGGADLVACAPYDLLSPSDSTRARAAHLASTTGLVAVLESHLAVADDPLRGAYFVETATSQMIEAAWPIVREIERQGGAAAAEPWRARLTDEGRERQRAACTGKLPRVGATRLARVDAPMLGPTHASFAHVLRDAAAFEALRDERIARRTTVLVAGDPKKTAARAEYLREVLATWGAEVSTARVASASDSIARVSGAVTDAVVICAEDADLGALPPLARALSARSCVMVAGRPGAHESALREAGVAAFVHLGADLPAVARAFYGAPVPSGAASGGVS